MKITMGFDHERAQTCIIFPYKCISAKCNLIQGMYIFLYLERSYSAKWFTHVKFIFVIVIVHILNGFVFSSCTICYGNSYVYEQKIRSYWTNVVDILYEGSFPSKFVKWFYSS